MRTREEQIEVLVDILKKPVCRPDYSVDTLRLWLENNILEAERRTEQRVRAEIGLDSERLDWLLSHLHYGIPGFDPFVRGRTPEKRKADLIRAIDAAREAG